MRAFKLFALVGLLFAALSFSAPQKAQAGAKVYFGPGGFHLSIGPRHRYWHPRRSRAYGYYYGPRYAYGRSYYDDDYYYPRYKKKRKYRKVYRKRKKYRNRNYRKARKWRKKRRNYYRIRNW